MKTDLFDYHLPKARIAQKSVVPRDMSRLMVLDRASEKISETQFRKIGDFLRKGDLLVVNDTKVFRARIFGKLQTGGTVEFLLLRCVTSSPTSSTWETLGKPGKKLQPGTKVFGKNWSVTVLEKNDHGMLTVSFDCSEKKLHKILQTEGHIPVPPYVGKEPLRDEQYQTVYAKCIGSVAAPTAGFHFTPTLIASLKKKGIRFASVTLHVGIGTFQPIMEEDLSSHEMHAEYAQIPEKTLQAIQKTKKSGGRVIVIGTTALRCLEGLLGEASVRKEGKELAGWVNMFITPGYKFTVPDGLITNFHLPKSTLLVLVSALAGRDFILRAYRRAVREKYRFFSFGDAMLIV